MINFYLFLNRSSSQPSGIAAPLKFFSYALNVCTLTAFLILLTSCASTPEARPKALLNAEYYLQQGTQAFYNDEYATAAQEFSQALKIYQSIDRETGILESHINLAETSIAIGNHSAAWQQLQTIEGLLENSPHSTYTNQVQLLKIKLLFNEQEYVSALALLEPILPQFDAQQNALSKNDDTLNIIISMTRISITTKSPQAGLWLQRLRQAINPQPEILNRYTAMFYRLQASLLESEGKLTESKSLLNQALDIYHQLAYRRGIAASLQQLATLEIKQQQWQQADLLLQRALKIHLWTLNQRDTIEVLQHLVDVNNQLGNINRSREFSTQLEKLSKFP